MASVTGYVGYVNAAEKACAKKRRRKKVSKKSWQSGRKQVLNGNPGMKMAMNRVPHGYYSKLGKRVPFRSHTPVTTTGIITGMSPKQCGAFIHEELENTECDVYYIYCAQGNASLEASIIIGNLYSKIRYAIETGSVRELNLHNMQLKGIDSDYGENRLSVTAVIDCIKILTDKSFDNGVLAVEINEDKTHVQLDPSGYYNNRQSTYENQVRAYSYAFESLLTGDIYINILSMVGKRITDTKEIMHNYITKKLGFHDDTSFDTVIKAICNLLYPLQQRQKYLHEQEGVSLVKPVVNHIKQDDFFACKRMGKESVLAVQYPVTYSAATVKANITAMSVHLMNKGQHADKECSLLYNKRGITTQAGFKYGSDFSAAKSVNCSEIKDELHDNSMIGNDTYSGDNQDDCCGNESTSDEDDNDDDQEKEDDNTDDDTDDLVRPVTIKYEIKQMKNKREYNFEDTNLAEKNISNAMLLCKDTAGILLTAAQRLSLVWPNKLFYAAKQIDGEKYVRFMFCKGKFKELVFEVSRCLKQMINHKQYFIDQVGSLHAAFRGEAAKEKNIRPSLVNASGVETDLLLCAKMAVATAAHALRRLHKNFNVLERQLRDTIPNYDSIPDSTDIDIPKDIELEFLARCNIPQRQLYHHEATGLMTPTDTIHYVFRLSARDHLSRMVPTRNGELPSIATLQERIQPVDKKYIQQCIQPTGDMLFTPLHNNANALYKYMAEMQSYPAVPPNLSAISVVNQTTPNGLGKKYAVHEPGVNSRLRVGSLTDIRTCPQDGAAFKESGFLDPCEQARIEVCRCCMYTYDGADQTYYFNNIMNMTATQTLRLLAFKTEIQYKAGVGCFCKEHDDLLLYRFNRYMEYTCGALSK